MTRLSVSIDRYRSPKELMECDARILETCDEPFLRLYTWPHPSFSWGLFTDPGKLMTQKAFEDIPHARRPTGGGLLFHGRDLSLSLFLPKAHPLFSTAIQETCSSIHSLLFQSLIPLLKPEYISRITDRSTPHAASLSPSHFCQAEATPYDMLFGQQKLAGAAERRTKRALLHQASLFLVPPDWDLWEAYVCDRNVLRHMQHTIMPLCTLVRDSAYVDESFLAAHLEKHLPELLQNIPLSCTSTK